LPIIHSGLVRENFGYINELRNVKKNLSPVIFDWVPIFSSQNFVNSNKLTFNLFHNFISYFLLYSKLKNTHVKLIHCRSYHAAWAAIQVRDKYKLNYKIIFDGRDLWPEEVALKKGWNDSSKDYLFLKLI
jgi:hypothetical protein